MARTAFALMAIASVVAGCSLLEQRPAPEVVKERAQGRWDAMVKSDLRTAYQYLSPGTRDVMSLERYEAGINKGFWRSATVDRVECSSADRCEAHATIEYDFQGRRTKTPLREIWIREQSNWWYVAK